ncbi:glycosyltransferase [Cellulomonas sp. DKR-3]|uniref:D-inositol 3-phosphate glycosyltransferase n=1 Tax=Cellulomonas fulva TaxID=2835530 RepID=A0ABS5TZQ7_9CELL|nr:glycosyltransferase [Cellulomonas fulva]MBT0994614.1 glycosyltransferase [Cellulomonas fulva]
MPPASDPVPDEPRAAGAEPATASGTSGPAPLARLGRLARDVLPALSVARAHLGRHRTVAATRALRALPAPVRRRLAGAVGRTPGVLGALCLGADGRTSAAADALDRLAVRDGGRHAGAAAVAAVALHRADVARRALAEVPADARGRARVAALVAAEEGHLTEAVAALEDSRSPAERRLHADLAAELAVLTPGRLSARAPQHGAPRTARPAARVLHLVTNALPEVQAGYTTRTHGIATAQAAQAGQAGQAQQGEQGGRGEQGGSVHVATRLGFPVTAGHLGAPERVERDGVTYHRLLGARPLPRRADERLAADVRATTALARRLRPDVLHAHSKFLNADVALRVGADLGVPVVYEVRGFLEETWRSRGGDPAADLYRGARARETEVMLAADAVVTISAGMRDAVVARGVPADRVHVVPNAVDDRFVGPVADGRRVRGRLGVRDHEVVVGTVTTVNDYEGVDVLVAAVALLRERGLPVRLLVVGSGPALAGVRALAQELLPGAADLPGRVPFAEVPAWHAAIDVFAVPRRDLPVTSAVTPIKPLEALASGRPVVASGLPALREIVTPAWGGFATPDDETALADALETYVTDPDARRRAGAAGRAWVLAERTWRGAADQYAALYRGL